MRISWTLGREARRGGSWVAAGLSLFLLAGCSSQLDVGFKLMDPCDQSVIAGLGCLYVRVVISSQDPNDPLYPGSPLGGPLAKTCDMLKGSCTLNGDELVGMARVVDVLCQTDPTGEPLGRATSNPFLFESGEGGADGMRVNLLLGPINSFINTTVLEGMNAGQCSQLAQDSGRYGHTATLLEDGRILIAGGMRRLQNGADEILATAEIFDPRTGTHSMVMDESGILPAKMTQPSGRAFHTATRLRDGRVLLTGGVGDIGNPPRWSSLRSAELFDPISNRFTSPMDMRASRAHHAAVMLATGKVLLVGGAVYDGRNNITDYLDSAVLFDPSTGAWTDAGTSMQAKRAFHQAVVLDPSLYGGKVFVVGGENASGVLNTMEMYRPEDNQFYPAGTNYPTMSKSRSRLCAVRIDKDGPSKGKVLIIAGTTTTGADPIVDRTVELYDPAAGAVGAFTPDVATLGAARMDMTCSALDNGDVLIAGGLTGGNATTGLAELIEESNGAFTATALPEQLNPPRYMHAATTLANGWVLLTGGLPNTETTATAVLQSILFVPPPPY